MHSHSEGQNFSEMSQKDLRILTDEQCKKESR